MAEYRGPCLCWASTSGRRRPARRRSRTGLQTGALRTWLAFGNVPDLGDARPTRDSGPIILPWSGVANCGPIRGAPCRLTCSCCRLKRTWTVPKSARAIADGYRCGELLDVCPWPLEVVRSGTGPSGSAAVRAFQRAVLTKTIATVENLFPDQRDRGKHAQKRRERESGHRQGAIGWAGSTCSARRSWRWARRRCVRSRSRWPSTPSTRPSRPPNSPHTARQVPRVRPSDTQGLYPRHPRGSRSVRRALRDS